MSAALEHATRAGTPYPDTETGAPGTGWCAGHGPGQEPDCARRPLSAGTPALRGQARPTRNPRAVTEPHPAHTCDTYGASYQFKGSRPLGRQAAGWQATWEFGGQVSWIEVRLTAEPEGGTRLVLEHIAHVNDELWAEFGPGAVGIGWDMGFMGLAVHLSSGRSADRGESAAWAASAEGGQFMTLASQRWCEASIAAGTDEAAARAAADRTTAAYTTTGS
jgi:hypothetical protein